MDYDPTKRSDAPDDLESQVHRIADEAFRQPGRPTDEVDAILRRVQRIVSNFGFVIVVGAIILWFATGIYVVGPGEVGVVRFFGREVGQTQPGLHYRLPAPIQQVDIVDVEQIRRIEIGFRSGEGGVQRILDEALMLTGDENILQAQIIVQYRVKDPSAYLFRLRDPDEAVRATTEVALRSMIGNSDIESALTVGREQIQIDTHDFLQRLLDYYESGILVTNVRLQAVDAPDQVRDAFNEVVRAREDRERLINEALGYQEDILPKARGEAEAVRREAEAFREQRVIQAQGDVSRFLAVLEEYRKGREVTRERLYLESIERILARLDKIIIDGETANGVLPFLPLRGMDQSGGATRTVPSSVPQAPAQPPAQAPSQAPSQ